MGNNIRVRILINRSIKQLSRISIYEKLIRRRHGAQSHEAIRNRWQAKANNKPSRSSLAILPNSNTEKKKLNLYRRDNVLLSRIPSQYWVEYAVHRRLGLCVPVVSIVQVLYLPCVLVSAGGNSQCSYHELILQRMDDLAAISRTVK